MTDLQATAPTVFSTIAKSPQSSSGALIGPDGLSGADQPAWDSETIQIEIVRVAERTQSEQLDGVEPTTQFAFQTAQQLVKYLATLGSFKSKPVVSAMPDGGIMFHGLDEEGLADVVVEVGPDGDVDLSGLD